MQTKNDLVKVIKSGSSNNLFKRKQKSMALKTGGLDMGKKFL